MDAVLLDTCCEVLEIQCILFISEFVNGIGKHLMTGADLNISTVRFRVSSDSLTSHLPTSQSPTSQCFFPFASSFSSKKAFAPK